MSSHHKTALGAAGQSRPPAAERQPLRGRRKRGFLVGLCAHAALALRGCWSCQALLADDWLAPSPVSPWTSAARNSRGRVRAMPAARTVPREPHRPRRLRGATRLIVVAPARRRSGQGAGSRTAAPFARRRTTSSDAGTAQCGRQRLAAGGGRQRAPGAPQEAQEGRSAASGAGSPPDGARGRQDGSGRPGGQPSPERRRQPRRAGQRLEGQESPSDGARRRQDGSGGPGGHPSPVGGCGAALDAPGRRLGHAGRPGGRRSREPGQEARRPAIERARPGGRLIAP